MTDIGDAASAKLDSGNHKLTLKYVANVYAQMLKPWNTAESTAMNIYNEDKANIDSDIVKRLRNRPIGSSTAAIARSLIFIILVKNDRLLNGDDAIGLIELGEQAGLTAEQASSPFVNL